MSRRWWRRAGAGLLVFVALAVGLGIAEVGPDPVRLALLVATTVAVLGLALDALSDPAASWDMEVERASLRDGGDPRLSLYVNLVEGHFAARAADPALRDRLRALADQVLSQRHGVLDPELTAVLTGPVRRLSPADVDRCLTRIEEL